MRDFKRWPVRHLELGSGVPALEAEPGIAGLFVVVWWRSVPLAHLEVGADRLPMQPFDVRHEVITAIAPTLAGYLRAARSGAADAHEALAESRLLEQLLSALDAPLERLFEPEPGARAGRPPSVSVVICTRNRPAPLARCLDSLAGLTLQPEQILIVDNAPSSSETQLLVAARPGVDYVLEPEPGLDRARNAGVRHSRGDIIAYIDDDVTLHPQWLQRICQGFDDDSVMAVTGLVLPAELETAAQYCFEKYWGFNRGYVPLLYDQAFYTQTRERATPVWNIGAGANMAFRRGAFERLGGFDNRLDAGAAGVAGDSEFWYRVLHAGFSCRYQPAAVVYHFHRGELSALRNQVFNYMRGHVTALLVQHARYGDRGNLRRLWSDLPQYYADVAFRALRPKYRERAVTLRAELAGCAAGLRYYWQTRAQAADAVPTFAARPSSRGEDRLAAAGHVASESG